MNVIAGAALIGLVACVETSTPDTSATGTVLTTETAFRAAIVGKTIGFEGNTLIVNANNTISGPWDGSGITGTWSWQDKYWCRDIAIGGTERAPDCQVWAIDGATATVTRDRGNGSTFVYSVN